MLPYAPPSPATAISVYRSPQVEPDYQKLLRRSASPFSEAELGTTLKRLESLRGTEENFNEALNRAGNWTLRLYENVVSQGERWVAPHMTVSPNDEVVLEWWNGEKKLTVYVSEETTEYVKVWGADIFEEMEDGNTDESRQAYYLWNWLVK